MDTIERLGHTRDFVRRKHARNNGVAKRLKLGNMVLGHPRSANR